MNYGIYSNDSRDTGYQVAKRTAEIILKCGGTPVFAKEFEREFDAPEGTVFENFGKIPLKTIISIGGDGTFLSVVEKYRELDTEFVGVNKGSIGFLTEINVDDLENDIAALVKGEYKILERTQLEVQVFSKDGTLKGTEECLNDIMIVRGAKPHVTKLTLSIDGQKIERFHGDGLIIATATGSTAYSLAAGGPLLMPSMEDIIVTPICSHTFNGFTYVTGSDSVVRIDLDNFESAPMICPDGRSFVELEPFDYIIIKRYSRVLKTVSLKNDNFFSNVRKKIVQRGSFYEDR